MRKKSKFCYLKLKIGLNEGGWGDAYWLHRHLESLMEGVRIPQIGNPDRYVWGICAKIFEYIAFDNFRIKLDALKVALARSLGRNSGRNHSDGGAARIRIGRQLTAAKQRAPNHHAGGRKQYECHNQQALLLRVF